MAKIKALVVDDSAYNRTAIAKMLTSDPELEVVASAIDGVDAVAKTIRYKPDVITLDLEMPGMDGFTFLRWLMKEQPTPVIVLSSRSERRNVFRALELGAVEFLAKPEARISKSLETLEEDLVRTVRSVMHLEMSKVASTMELLAKEKTARKPAVVAGTTPERTAAVEVVAIASSTGGPQALQAILTELPADLKAGIVISQHMPPEFTRSFAERMNKLSDLSVREAVDGERVRPGVALVAPGGKNLIIKKNRATIVTEIIPRDPSDRYVPSADRMMQSVADACGPAAIGIVLTGMGSDGAIGTIAIKQRQGYCIAESAESAVIFGMPQEAIRTGAVDLVLPLERIAGEIVKLCGRAQGMPR